MSEEPLRTRGAEVPLRTRGAEVPLRTRGAEVPLRTRGAEVPLRTRGAEVPWGTGLTVSAFVAAVTAGAIMVLSMGLTRVNPLLAVGLNLVAVGGLAPTVWGWRTRPVWRWFVLGAGVGVVIGWLALIAMALGSFAG